MSTLADRLAPLRQRYEALAPRERRLVLAAAAALALFLPWQLVWVPLQEAVASAEARAAQRRVELAQMQRLAAATALALFLPWQLVWVPLQEAVASAEARAAQRRVELAQMQRLAAEARTLRARVGAAARPVSGQPLLTRVDQSARRVLGGALKGIKEEGKEGVRVRFENADFDALMRWLDQLQTRDGVVVAELVAERQQAPGRVSGRVLVEAP